MKHLIFFSIFFLLFSCQSMLFNAGFEALGIYDDEAKLHFSESDSKKIILLPTHHIGTQLYYDDLKYKIDSLAALNFYFYTERVKAKIHCLENSESLVEIQCQVLDTKTSWIQYGEKNIK